jgi:hypothetical protein
MANSVSDVQFIVTFKLMDNGISDSLSNNYRLTFVIPKILTSSSQVAVYKNNTKS